MKHSVGHMRAQGLESVEKHRGDGLAPMVVDLCHEVASLEARLAHALYYVSDDDMALATSLPGEQAPEGNLDDDEGTARRVNDDNTLGSDQTPPDERRDLGKSANEDA